MTHGRLVEFSLLLQTALQQDQDASVMTLMESYHSDTESLFWSNVESVWEYGENGKKSSTVLHLVRQIGSG